MSPPPQLPLLLKSPPKPQQKFDPWNSSSTGHQRAEGPGGGTHWRTLRNNRLRTQFAGGLAGGPVRSEKDLDKEAIRASGVQIQAGVSVMDMLVHPGIMRRRIEASSTVEAPRCEGWEGMTEEERLAEKRRAEDEAREAERRERKAGMFEGVVVYVNGSTYPHISDHRLKQVLAENGARMSLHLGRRQVTHVILGRPAAAGKGAGGGLAGMKLEREIRRVGGCGVKYVGVEWVLESLKAGKRLPEARFSNLKIAHSGQNSVYGLLKKPI